MKKLDKLRLQNFTEICHDEQKSLIGGSGWVTCNGQQYYLLDDVSVTSQSDVRWACSRDQGVVFAGFVLEGLDGSGGLFGAGQHFGNLSEEQKEALIGISVSILGVIAKIADPLILGIETIWNNFESLPNTDSCTIAVNGN